MKIGLLGGSFNPIHNGHLIVAQTVKDKLDLDQIWFLPTANHPFKEKNFVLPFQKRYDLIKKAISNYPDLFVRDDDFTDKGFNYTVHLLKKLYCIKILKLLSKLSLKTMKLFVIPTK